MARGRRRTITNSNGEVISANPAVLPPLPPEDVPEWSPETMAALDELTPNERLFAEYISMGDNAAEAYRRVSGREYTDRESDTTRMIGYQWRSRPRVDKAIRLCMKDMNFGAAMDREWILQRLRVALEKAEASNAPYAQQIAGELLDRIAKLKGEYLPEKQEITVTHEVSPAMKRFLAAVEMAKARRQGTVVRVEAEAIEDAPSLDQS